MAVQVDKTVELHIEEAGSGDPLEAADLTDLAKRINAQEELIKDAACQGAVGRTYRGHDHDPGSAGAPGRGIMRMVDGGFQISDTPVTHTVSTTAPTSIAIGATANSYVASSAPTALNYIMGKAEVSPGLNQIRVEACMKVSTLSGSPRWRVKNLTDTTSSDPADIKASEWVYFSTTDPYWYGSQPTEKATLPVTRTTSQKELDLDIEVSVAEDGNSVEFSLYAAFPYEFVDEF